MVSDDENKTLPNDNPSDDVNGWSAVSSIGGKRSRKFGLREEEAFNSGLDNFLSSKIDFVGKNLQKGKFQKENLSDANFSVSNLEGVDFSGSNLRNADFTGANLAGANFSGAILDGAIFDGAQLAGADFTGASLKGIKLAEADISDAVLLDIDIDAVGIEELQELVEFLAKYYPHKLNLSKINLALLNLAQIDLRAVNLRGVDFTGCSFVGVNIFELDLSEAIITPEQMAQALGRPPTKDEIAKIMAPKKRGGNQKSGVMNEISDLFSDRREFGVIDFRGDKGVSIDKAIKKVIPNKEKGKDSGEKKDEKSHNDDLKKALLEERKRQYKESKEQERALKEEIRKEMQRDRAYKVRGRDGRS